MASDKNAVAKNMVVSLEYVVKLDNGEELDRSESGAPLEYLHGHRNIIPGLEKALTGMAEGEERELSIPPADAYGEYDPDATREVARGDIPAHIKLEEGTTLNVNDKKTGRKRQAVVQELRGKKVVLDYNHPLAGETLHFWARIAGLRAATDEELAHGHVHSPGHHH